MITNNEEFDHFLDSIDDEIDCAIIGDEELEKTINDLYDCEDCKNEEPVDVNADYSEDIHDPDFIDIDADDMIAAEREIMMNPFEEDELLADDIIVDDEE